MIKYRADLWNFKVDMVEIERQEEHFVVLKPQDGGVEIRELINSTHHRYYDAEKPAKGCVKEALRGAIAMRRQQLDRLETRLKAL